MLIVWFLFQDPAAENEEEDSDDEGIKCINS